MQTVEEFKASLEQGTPPAGLSLQLKALWYDGKENWPKAHQQVDQQDDLESAHIHAYLHRKEGDVWNADYWYRRAGKTRPTCSLDEEWEQLLNAYL